MTFQFPACFTLSSKLSVMVQGKQELPLRFQGSVVYPELKLSPERIQMGRIKVSSAVTHLISATNSGDSEVTIEFQLDEYPEFRVHEATDTRDSPIDYSRDYSASVNKVKIPGKSTRYINIDFEPIDLASFAFYLPMIVNGQLGPCKFDEPESLKPKYHTREVDKYYEKLANVQMSNHLPKRLSTIYIDCTVCLPSVNFNKTRFKLDETKSFVITTYMHKPSFFNNIMNKQLCTLINPSGRVENQQRVSHSAGISGNAYGRLCS